MMQIEGNFLELVKGLEAGDTVNPGGSLFVS